ncbi:orotate phosphoribosyltransferase [Sorangium sp. So ce204]|uniref:orotate phosphoribosyltransferase n=1 Tax=Sorangium sp. So ce204 TaxID=3133288 RepID=UPI003F624F42
MHDHKRKLLKLLAKHAYAYKPGGFKLASGAISDEYLDCKQALSQAEALPALGRALLDMIDPRVTALGGLTMGADPIAIAASYASAEAARPLVWFSVRKDRKEHGRKKMIEGSVRQGVDVAIVDDVVTTGGSTIEAIRKCRDGGLHIVQVIVLVDREQGGLENIRQEVGPEIPIKPVFTKSEVRAEWEAQQKVSRLTV